MINLTQEESDYLKRNLKKLYTIAEKKDPESETTRMLKHFQVWCEGDSLDLPGGTKLKQFISKFLARMINDLTTKSIPRYTKRNDPEGVEYCENKKDMLKALKKKME